MGRGRASDREDQQEDNGSDDGNDEAVEVWPGNPGHPEHAEQTAPDYGPHDAQARASGGRDEILLLPSFVGEPWEHIIGGP